MSKRKKTWQEKLSESKGLPRVERVTPGMAGRWGTKAGDTVVIPAPIEVDEIMKSVPEGQLITINQIREILAKKHGTTIACPITTGIFARIAAEASAELFALQGKYPTPYWRTLKTGGVINEKYPGGIETQKTLLEQEGFTVAKKGKNWIVKNFENFLIQPNSGFFQPS